MKQLVPIAVTAIAVAALTVALSVASAKVEVIKETVTETVYEAKGLTPAQLIWFAQLANCESDTKIGALNPKDSNGLPSRNFLQFQDTTLTGFAAKYDIDVTLQDTAQRISEAQAEIVTHWLLNPGEVIWENQFPLCVRKLGLPPQ